MQHNAKLKVCAQAIRRLTAVLAEAEGQTQSCKG